MTLALRARLDALASEEPLPLGDAFALPDVSDADRLVLTFVRMGGESIPWGLAFGHPGESPTILTIPEPRDRDLVARLVTPLADALDAHLGHPRLGDVVDFAQRQLWLPGHAHVDMLHHLALRFTNARRTDEDLVVTLNRLGRACGFLHREATREGQLAVIDAARLLAEHWTFPVEPARQTHLGFLLAWLRTRAPLDRRRHTAREAERLSVGTTLDPHLENDELAPRVEEWNASKGKGRVHARVEQQLHDRLEVELARRFALVVDAVRLVDADPRRANSELGDLEEAARRSHEGDYLRIELALVDEGVAFVPSPETDHHSAGAAARFFSHLAAAEDHASSLVHGDASIFARLQESGDAFEARMIRLDDEGVGRAHDPVWILETSAHTPLRLRLGACVCPVGQRKRQGRIREITRDGDTRRIVVAITDGKTRRAIPDGLDAHDPRLVGQTLRLVAAGSGARSRNLTFTAWKSDGPGAWLTHAKPRPSATLSSTRAEDLVSLVESLKGAPGTTGKRARKSR